MSYLVLARKWRPRLFSQMVGQEHVVRPLVNAIANDRLHHAYLFSGTRGVGKTTLARIFAKAVNCEVGLSPEPCGQCSTCREIDEGRYVDLLEVDAASRTKVEQTRELLENVPYSPVRGRFKVYLIDEVHMFSGHSFNALLKTLEEPPEHVKFLLATTDPQKLPVTVLSRCLQFHLKRLSFEQIHSQLQHIIKAEGVTTEPQALKRLARAADGSMRDALSLLDQAIVFGGGQVLEADVVAMLGGLTQGQIAGLFNALVDRDGKGVLRAIATIDEYGVDFSLVLQELLSLLHQVAVFQALPESLEYLGGDTGLLRSVASRLTPEDIQLYYQIGLVGQRDLPLAPDPRSGLEMVVLRMLAFRPEPSLMEPVPMAVSRPPTAQVKAAAASPSGQAAQTQTRVRPTPLTPVPQPSQAVPPVGGPEPPAATTAPRLELRGPGSWRRFVSSLRLGGVATQLANNCELVSWDGQSLELRLDPASQHLRVASAEKRLFEAMREALGGEVKIQLKVEVPQSETPAQTSRRLGEERQRSAEESIARDPLVQELTRTFGAKILPGSLKPMGPDPEQNI